MRNPLNKRIPRDFKKNLSKYLGMMLILFCTISIGSSFQATLNAAVSYLDTIKTKNLQEDGFIEVRSVLDEKVITELNNKGVALTDNFYAVENNFPNESKVLLFNERTKINTPSLFSGTLPKAANEIALDHTFCLNRNINLNDTVTLLGKEYVVCGFVSLPDYTALFMNNTDIMMNAYHFCVSLLSDEGFNKLDKGTLTLRYSYRFTDQDLTKKERNLLEEDAYKYLMSKGVVITNMLNRDQNQSISFLEMDIGTDGPFMTVFVYILVAMIAFIFAILTNGTIENESVMIGTLRALGFRKSEIIWHYLKPTLMIAVIGSILGNIVGYTLMIEPFLNVYYTTYSIGPLHVTFDPGTFLLTTILPVVIMIVINVYMLMRKLSLSPLKFLRKDLKKGKNRRYIKLPNVSFLNRFRMRVIIQNRGNYLLLFFGIFLASFLLMFGIGLDPLMDHYTKNIEKTLPFDYQYLLKEPVDAKDDEKLLITEYDTYFSLGKKDLSISCYGITKDNKYYKDAYREDGIVISSALAKKLSLKAGDNITLKDKAKETEYTFKIEDIFSYDASMTVFLSQAKLAKLMDVDPTYYNCLVSNEKLDIPNAKILKVITRSDLVGAASQMIDSFSTIILFINIFSVVVYVIILFILTRVVIEKNALSISYMKVFGYKDNEIKKLYLTATTIVVILSLVICIPMEIWLFKIVLVVLSSLIEGYIAFYLPISVYIEIILIGIICYFIINALHLSSIRKIPMSDALKNRE